MKSSATLIAVAAVLLGGCASHHHRSQCQCAPIDLVHMNPQITLRADAVAVGPDPLIFERGERDFRIVWRLQQAELTFPDNGIVIDGQVMNSSGQEVAPSADAGKGRQVVLDPKQAEIVDCRVSEDRRAFSCLNRHTKPGIYRYTIRVLNKGKLVQSDPTVMNY